MRVDGACHCGQVRYEAQIVPEHAVLCHCTDCQTLSGGPFRAVVPSVPGGFRLLAGRLTTYVKVAESGNRRAQTFCPVCGTPIYSAGAEGAAGVVGLRIGAIRQRDRLVPTEQYWCRSAQPWLRELPAIRQRSSQPGFTAGGRIGGAEDQSSAE